jgi:1-aminocyclopropane-1-carboxylate deaminase/D-cysteine desulfhydrase-like pyridoxal-dependent ACC family enzyme
LVAETEAILLDPVYTGKAMAGLMDFVQTQKLNTGKRILFWHTGGADVLSAYTSDLVRS